MVEKKHRTGRNSKSLKVWVNNWLGKLDKRREGGEKVEGQTKLGQTKACLAKHMQTVCLLGMEKL